MSKLLINENPLQVLPTLAQAVGLNNAIVLQQVHYWLENARKGKNVAKYKHGRYWVYNSYPDWQESNFPFWSIPTIKRVFLTLEKEGYLASGQFDGNDRRKWYTIDYTKLQQLELDIDTRGIPSDQIDTMEQIKMIPSKGSKRSNASDQNDPLQRIKLIPSTDQIDPMLNKELTETTTETTQETTRERGGKTTPAPAPDFHNPDNFHKNINLPEIMVYRQVTGRTPGTKQLKVIYRVIKEHDFTADYLRPFWEEWAAIRDYRAGGLAWLTEWAVSGEIPKQGSSRKAKPKKPEDYTAGEFAEFISH